MIIINYILKLKYLNNNVTKETMIMLVLKLYGLYFHQQKLKKFCFMEIPNGKWKICKFCNFLAFSASVTLCNLHFI